MDRKDFLQKTGLLSLGIISGTGLASAKSKPIKTMKDLRKIITVEEHFIIPSINAKVTQYLTEKNGGKPIISEAQKELMKMVLPDKSIAEVGEQRLAFMDKAGITMQVLSYGAGSPQNITDVDLAVLVKT